MLDLGGHTLTTQVTVNFQGGGLQDGTVLNSGAYAGTGGTVSASLEGTANLTMNGPGLLILSATNNSYNTTSIIGGALQATNTARLPGYNSGQVTINSGGALYLSVGGHGWSSPQIGLLLGAANFYGGTLGMDTTAGNFSYNTAITQDLSLTGLGPNVLTLGGAETYSGDTTVSGGTLAISAGGSLYGGTYYGAITINSGAMLNYGGTVVQTLTGQISGGGTLVKSGNGLLAISNDNSSYTGNTIVTAGVLAATNQASLGSGTVTVAGGTLSLQAQSYANAVNVTNNADIDVSQSLQAVIGPLTINAGTLTLSSSDGGGSPYSLTPSSLSMGGNATLHAVPSASGGAATLVLSSSAPVSVTSGGSNTIIANVVLDGNVGVTAASGAALTLSGSVTDNGSGYGLTLTGNGELVLSGTDNYSGETVVDGGTLALASPTALPSGNALIVGDNPNVRPPWISWRPWPPPVSMRRFRRRVSGWSRNPGPWHSWPRRHWPRRLPLGGPGKRRFRQYRRSGRP